MPGESLGCTMRECLENGFLKLPFCRLDYGGAVALVYLQGPQVQ